MAKFLSRLSTSKKDYLLTCTIVSFEATGYFTLGEANYPAKVSIQYIRGKTIEETPPFDFRGGRVKVGRAYEKVVDIYKENKTQKFQKKEVSIYLP